MKLPNLGRAFIDIRKLRDYVLDPNNARGRHKARVFKSALGITIEDVDALADAIRMGIHNAEATLGELDFYGQRYAVDCRIETGSGSALVRTGWIIRVGETFPRLTTCFVIRNRE